MQFIYSELIIKKKIFLIFLFNYHDYYSSWSTGHQYPEQHRGLDHQHLQPQGGGYRGWCRGRGRGRGNIGESGSSIKWNLKECSFCNTAALCTRDETLMTT